MVFNRCEGYIMYKIFVLAIAAILATVKVACEEMWLNEIHHQSGSVKIEIILRPDDDDLDKSDGATQVEVTWYGGGQAILPSKEVDVKPSTAAADELWVGNWFGTDEESGLSDAFNDEIGGIKLHSKLSHDSEVYCWGPKASEDVRLVPTDDDTECDSVVFRDVPNEPVDYAMIDKQSTPTGGGREESDFVFAPYVDNVGGIESIGQPNNCPSGKVCEPEIKQTLAVYSMAWSVRSFAVIVSAVVATLLSIGAA